MTDTELAILGVLWRSGAATIRQITAELYPAGKAAQYATVQKLLERLESKAFVGRDRSSFAHVFVATVERSDLIGRQLQEMAEKLCQGSLTPLLIHLAGGASLTDSDRRTLRKLIDDAQ